MRVNVVRAEISLEPEWLFKAAELAGILHLSDYICITPSGDAPHQGGGSRQLAVVRRGV